MKRLFLLITLAVLSGAVVWGAPSPDPTPTPPPAPGDSVSAPVGPNLPADVVLIDAVTGNKIQLIVPEGAVDRSGTLTVGFVDPASVQGAEELYDKMYPGAVIAVRAFAIIITADFTGEELSIAKPLTLISKLGAVSGIAAVQAWTPFGETEMWVPLGSEIAAIPSPDQIASGSPSGESSLTKLGVYRIAIVPVPQSGVSDLINFPNPFSPDAGGTNISYVLHENSNLDMAVYDLFGNLVRKWEFFSGSPGGLAGLNVFIWDGRNGEGEAIASGGYVLQIIAEGSDGKERVMRRKVGVAK